MAPLAPELRRDLEQAVLQAREVGERGARAALQVLAVDAERAFDTLSAAQKSERTALRARMKALATADTSYQDVLGGPPKGFTPLIEEVAYEQWHRMLFARFLEQNSLLIHPHHGVPVSLDECADVAADEGEPDEWMVAAKFAGVMLPGIFQRDDPAVRLRFAANDRNELERILKALPADVFTADDALGWVYQFWQTKAKDEVNRSGRKVSGKDLAPVTQLFTEHYIVRFLLENSLGAWWMTRHPTSLLIQEWPYLRLNTNGDPAVGQLVDWPDKASQITVMDPCCGSGHFLVRAADMLRKMRMEEEGLTGPDSARAVLQDNLFGLELDPRCTQLAAFALIFDAWKAGLEPSDIVLPNVACSGNAINGQLDDWRRLAGPDSGLQATLEGLYELFKNGPDLGSLINPTDVNSRDQLFTKEYSEVAPLLRRALDREGQDPAAAVFGAAAAGAERAGMLLTRQYTLVSTNVPYLGFKKMDGVLKDYVRLVHTDARHDLSTAFLDRIDAMVADGGSYAVVLPHNWLFLGSYTDFRRRLLTRRAIRLIARLGPGAFDSISGEVVNVVLATFERSAPLDSDAISAIDVSAARGAQGKADRLRDAEVGVVPQKSQLANPDARITLDAGTTGPQLGMYAEGLAGIMTGDFARFGRVHWEVQFPSKAWVREQSTVKATTLYGGCEYALLWEEGKGRLEEYATVNRQRVGGSPRRGLQAWGKRGVAVSSMGGLPVAIYVGVAFDNNTAVILPRDPADLAAIWAFCSSGEFNHAVRRIDQSLKVTNAAMVKVPFDRDRWKAVADKLYPHGLPEARSTDPTQWLFDGAIVGSDAPLQVAVARLVGFRWPDQEANALPQHSADDGIVCVPPLPGQPGAPERIRALLSAAYSDKWSAATIDDLTAAVGFAGASLERWLREGFFEQHCKLFHHRPFVWHIWDGRRDGFSALVNYHRLDRPTLEKLAFHYLGSWLERQRDEKNSGLPGADDRLAAAQALQRKLALILEGEPPYDIFVRWKKSGEQPVGWNPDPDDGVRVNIRPFLTAGVLRWRPNIKWDKDRGKNPDGSDRVNDCHMTIAAKREARKRAETAS